MYMNGRKEDLCRMFLGEHFSLSVTFAKVYNRVNDTDLFLYVLFCRENQEGKNLMFIHKKICGKKY